MAQRITDINPNIQVNIIEDFVTLDNLSELIETNVDYVVDAIDTLSPKIFFIKNCVERNITLVSSMGSENGLNETVGSL